MFPLEQGTKTNKHKGLTGGIAMHKLRDLVRWYMLQYSYTRREAIASIRADLRDIQQEGN